MFSFLIGIILLAIAALLHLFGSKLHLTSVPRRMPNGEIVHDVVSPGAQRIAAIITGQFAPLVLDALAIVFLVNSMFVEVPAGNQGIVLTFKAASQKTLDPGLGFKLPWQTIKPVSTRASAWTEKFECQSKDLQKMWVEMTLVYRRDINQVADIYKRVREESAEIDVKPGGRETLKAAVAEFDAAMLIQNRQELGKKVTEGMKSWINPKGLDMMSCSIANVDFEPSYDERVEAKVIALEKARQAQNELIMKETMAEIRKMAASGEKEAKREQARGESQSRQIVAEAEAYKTEVVATAEAHSRSVLGAAEAERMTWLAKAVGDSRAALTLEAITKWNGDVPNFAMEGQQPSLPFEFLKSTEALQAYDSPINDLETALQQHQERMAAEAAERQAEEERLEQERIEREKADAEALAL